MAQSNFFQEQEKYDYLQFVVPDVNTIPRGKVVKGRFKEKVAKNGFDMPSCACVTGPNSEMDLSITDIVGFGNGKMQPCLDTLTPWPWMKKEGRRIGNVLCDLFLNDGTPDLTSPRQNMKVQLDTLREQHGLVLKSAFEYEFDVFKADTMELLGTDKCQLFDMRVWNRHHELFCELTELLEAMGVEVEFLTPEFPPGQWEITTEPQEGLRGGDVGFYIKNAVKGFFETRGYTATFMAKPTIEHLSLGLHLNHSLWSKEGDEEKNVMLDKTDPDLLSPTARHWLAGILTHTPALTALCCPTLNCYRRFNNFCTPATITWGVDDRNALIRVRNAHDNVFFENRLPSGPSNPYLAIAATVAAGMDGLNRKLPCPKALDMDQAGQPPKTLADALDALDKDEQLRSLLGDRFVDGFTLSKKGYEVKKFDTTVLNTEEKQMEFERKMYMYNL